MKSPNLCLLVCAAAAIFCGCQTNHASSRGEPTDNASGDQGTIRWPPLSDGAVSLPVGVNIHAVRDAEAEAGNALQQRLLEKTVSLSNDNLTLELIIRFARDVTGANIAVNWPALELVGVDQDSLVTIGLQNVSVHRLLDLTFDQVSADAFGDDKVGFAIDDGVVIVTTQRALKLRTEIRIYDVRWFLYQQDKLNSSLYRHHERAEELQALMQEGAWPLITMAPPFDLNDAVMGSTAPSAATPERIEPPSTRETEAAESPTYMERVDILESLIETAIGDPDVWLDEYSTIYEMNGSLVINTTRNNHAEIQALLMSLRVAQVQHFQKQARLIEVFLLLERAESYRLRQDHRRALRYIDAALRVDPANPETIALKQIITDTLSH